MRTLLTLGVFGFLLAGPAWAADLSRPAKAPEQAPPAEPIPVEPAPAEKPGPPNWWYYLSTSPVADLRLRPNLSANFLIGRFMIGLKGSYFLNANEVVGWGLVTNNDGAISTAQAKGFEAGPQIGYLLDAAGWGAYLMPRVGVYRSVVNYTGGTSGCSYPAGVSVTCSPPNAVGGWVVEAMAMMHVPVSGHFHIEGGAGVNSQNLLLEVNMGFAGF